MGLETIMETVNSELFGMWFLIGAVLVFFMQCGFAMVETGFTRAKNAGNIIMKNLMDFCIGTVMFILLGYGLMYGRGLYRRGDRYAQPGHFRELQELHMISTGPTLYLTWCSVPRRPPLCPALWQSVPSFLPTAFTQQ